MTTAAATLNSRDPFMPRRPPGMRTGLVLALLAHAVLIAGLAYSVDWHASDPVAVEAELWSATPQQAAAAPAAPPPAPPPLQTVAPTPAPPPKPPPVPPAPPPQVDPQIAIEKAREVKRVQQQELAEQEQAKREKTRRDQTRQAEADRKAEQARDDATRKQQQLAERQQADKEKAEQAKAEQAKADKADKAAAAQREAARLAQIKRMQSLAGATGDSNATGSATKSSGPSASYGGRIVARIKPNIVFPDSVDGNPLAIVEVRAAPDGSITGRRLVQSSGVKAWDDAVLRAIDRTDGLPRDIDGRVPSVLEIKFRPRDL